MYLKKEGALQDLPFLCKTWIEISNLATCMYPKALGALSTFEIVNSPWWVDMPKGQIMSRENDLYDAMLKQV